jgi:hypothetical protein
VTAPNDWTGQAEEVRLQETGRDGNFMFRYPDAFGSAPLVTGKYKVEWFGQQTPTAKMVPLMTETVGLVWP